MKTCSSEGIIKHFKRFYAFVLKLISLNFVCT